MFRFTIRDVLWLTVVVALLLALFNEYSAAKIVKAAVEEARKMRSNAGTVKITDQYAGYFIEVRAARESDKLWGGQGPSSKR